MYPPVGAGQGEGEKTQGKAGICCPSPSTCLSNSSPLTSSQVLGIITESSRPWYFLQGFSHGNSCCNSLMSLMPILTTDSHGNLPRKCLRCFLQWPTNGRPLWHIGRHQKLSGELTQLRHRKRTRIRPVQQLKANARKGSKQTVSFFFFLRDHYKFIGSCKWWYRDPVEPLPSFPQGLQHGKLSYSIPTRMLTMRPSPLDTRTAPSPQGPQTVVSHSHIYSSLPATISLFSTCISLSLQSVM